ncbi:MAG: hypothetical protein KDK23_15080 [Leptospiraceae bacterium]|nr:hypothetical protein [Leptospiraceae bacterium]
MAVILALFGSGITELCAEKTSVPESKILFLQEYLRSLGHDYSAKEVKEMKAMHFLYLDASPTGLGQFRALPEIESVVLSGDPFYNSHLRALSGFPSLKQLVLSGDCSQPPLMNDDGLKYVSSMKQLESLNLICTEISDQGLPHLANLKNLQFLGLSQTNELKGTGFLSLSELPNLKKLKLGDVKLEEVSLPELAQHLEVQTLMLHNVSFARCKAETRSNSELKHLFITGLNRKDWHPDCLKGFQALQSLWLPSVLEDQDLQFLSGMQKLEELRLPDSHIQGQGLIHLEGNRSLVKVVADCSALNDSGMKHLSRLPLLQELHLYSTKVSDVGLAYFRGHSEIRSMVLPDNGKLDTSGMRILATLPALRVMVISDRDLRKNRIELARLKQLQELRVHGGLNRESKERARAMLPGVKIIDYGSPPSRCDG